jgi:hypothetical protein
MLTLHLLPELSSVNAYGRGCDVTMGHGVEGIYAAMTPQGYEQDWALQA